METVTIKGRGGNDVQRKMIVFRELKLLGMIFGNNIIYNIHLGHDGTTSLRWKM